MATALLPCFCVPRAVLCAWCPPSEALAAFCRLGRGLSPVPSAIKCGSSEEKRAPPMADSTETPTLPATDPALLTIDGAIATITLNRPAAFNAIDLSIAKKLDE